MNKNMITRIQSNYEYVAYYYWQTGVGWLHGWRDIDDYDNNLGWETWLGLIALSGIPEDQPLNSDGVAAIDLILAKLFK